MSSGRYNPIPRYYHTSASLTLHPTNNSHHPLSAFTATRTSQIPIPLSIRPIPGPGFILTACEGSARRWTIVLARQEEQPPHGLLESLGVEGERVAEVENDLRLERVGYRGLGDADGVSRGDGDNEGLKAGTMLAKRDPFFLSVSRTELGPERAGGGCTYRDWAGAGGLIVAAVPTEQAVGRGVPEAEILLELVPE